jgi:hypothetical protein
MRETQNRLMNGYENTFDSEIVQQLVHRGDCGRHLNQQPSNYPASFSQTVGPERTDARARQSDAMKSEDGILRQHEVRAILTWNHGGLND